MESFLVAILKAKDLLNEERKEELKFFFQERNLRVFLENVDDFLLFEKRRTIPFFEEELSVDWKEIWKRYHSDFSRLSEIPMTQQIPEIAQLLESAPIIELLILMGQRFTPGSCQNESAFPPEMDCLKAHVFTPYNAQISVGVRAWEKHVGRTELPFWGSIEGTPTERYVYVVQLVDQLFESICWWNTFEHYKHGMIYEIREKEGHGLRWSIEPMQFLGFVEPFSVEYE